MTYYPNYYYTKLTQETTVVQKLRMGLTQTNIEFLLVPLHIDTILEIIRDCYDTSQSLIHVPVQHVNMTNRMNKDLFVFSCKINGLGPIKRVERQLLR